MPTTKDFDYLEIEGLGTFKPAGSGGDGEAPVQSVNGKTGTVVLDAEDVGALPADTDIPDEVTEQTVAGWGFTKNTGDYSKPSGGIPKTDLASDVQTSLGKADTALQQHQSLAGYATETWVNQQGFLKQHQDISGKADKVLRVAMTSADTTPTLDPNKLYVFPEMATLTPTLATPADNTIVNEYHFVFDSGATATVLTLPASVLQPDGFTVEANMHYEISILEGAMTAQGWAVTA